MNKWQNPDSSQKEIKNGLWTCWKMFNKRNWTIKKAEHQRMDALELWFWRRLLRVPWTARRSNQSILKEISLEYLLEGLMLKLKLQYFGHLMRRADSFEKMLGSSVQFSRSVMSDSLRPHGLQHARLPCPSLSSTVCWNSYSLGRWCIQPSHPLSSLLLLPSIFPSIRVFSN